MNLQDAGLLKLKDKKLNWTGLKKNFKLVNEEVNPHSPQDISYVYNGYSPLSVKLLETLMERQGVRKMEEMIKQLPGTVTAPKNEAEFFAPPARIGGPESLRKKKVLVYYLGGVTFAEIAAIRFLNKLF